MADRARLRASVLPSGLRIVTEAVPGVRSAAFGVFVHVGSRDEPATLYGASHFLEHLLFKGTRRRTAFEIATAMDAVGGEANAFTTKEYTCFHARVLGRDLPLAVDVVCDQVTGSLVAAADVEAERGVVLEEIAMHDDDPADVDDDAFVGLVLGDGPLGHPVLGSEDSIEAMTAAAVRGYYRRRYRPAATVVAASGAVRHEDVVRLVADAFGEDAADAVPREPATAPPPPRRHRRAAAPTAGRVVVLDRPTEQASLVLGGPGLPRSDGRRYALALLDSVLGGGQSSRLFQEVREKRGLAYSVYSAHSGYAETGLLSVSVGCAPERASDVLHLCREVLDGLRAGPAEEELERARGQALAGFLLDQEDTSARMHRIGRGELLDGAAPSVAEVAGRLRQVTLDDVRALADELFGRPMALSAVGPFRPGSFDPDTSGPDTSGPERFANDRALLAS